MDEKEQYYLDVIHSGRSVSAYNPTFKAGSRITEMAGASSGIRCQSDIVYDQKPIDTGK